MPQDAAFPVHCPKCAVVVAADSRCVWNPNPELELDVFGAPTEIQTWKQFILASCPQCESPFLLEEEVSEFEGVKRWRVGFQVVYPASTDVAFDDAPQPLKSAYSEAKKSFSGSAYTAAVVMVRKAIEAIARDKGYEERTLDKALRKMRDDGVLEKTLADWFDLLRLAGNDAAHDIDTEFTREDAADCIAFLEGIVEYLYAYRGKYDAFVARREARVPKPKE